MILKLGEGLIKITAKQLESDTWLGEGSFGSVSAIKIGTDPVITIAVKVRYFLWLLTNQWSDFLCHSILPYVKSSDGTRLFESNSSLSLVVNTGACIRRKVIMARINSSTCRFCHAKIDFRHHAWNGWWWKYSAPKISCIWSASTVHSSISYVTRTVQLSFLAPIFSLFFQDRRELCLFMEPMNISLKKFYQTMHPLDGNTRSMLDSLIWRLMHDVGSHTLFFFA